MAVWAGRPRPGSRASNPAPATWWPHSAIHTGGSGSPTASRNTCASWSRRRASIEDRAPPNTATGRGGACGLTCQLVWVWAVLGEVAHDLRRNAGTRRRNGKVTAGGGPDDDEQRGLRAVEHG